VTKDAKDAFEEALTLSVALDVLIRGMAPSSFVVCSP